MTHGGGDQPNDDPAEDPKAQVELAIAKAEKLLAKVSAQAIDLEKHPPNRPAEQLAAGREAMKGALASLARMVENLKAARDTAGEQGD